MTMRGRSAATAAAAVCLLGLLAGCSGDGSGRRGAEPGPTATAPAAAITVTPADDTDAVRLDSPVQVTVTGGRLTGVTLTPEGGGKSLTGALAAGGAGWTARPALKPGTTYTVRADAKGPTGTPATLSTTFTTLTPERTATASVLPGADWTVGVGMPVIVDFSDDVENRAAATGALTVSSRPAVEGAWRWTTDRQVQWRPKEFWPSGAEVTLKSRLAGVELAPGVWGKSNLTRDFTVGSAMVSTVDIDRHTMTVRQDGAVLRTIPVTTGKRGFATRKGTKVIMSRESSRRMDAASTGTDPADPEYYDLDVEFAMRLTYSGEFVHAAPWSTGSQGRANVSHGCTGMSTEDARWLFSRSKVGDVVQYTGGSRTMEWGNGYTAWEMPYEKWAAGT